jgi:hypothetical protein
MVYPASPEIARERVPNIQMDRQPSVNGFPPAEAVEEFAEAVSRSQSSCVAVMLRWSY